MKAIIYIHTHIYQFLFIFILYHIISLLLYLVRDRVNSNYVYITNDVRYSRPYTPLYYNVDRDFVHEILEDMLAHVTYICI